MFDQAGVGMAHVSLEGSLLRANPKLCVSLGLEIEELLGRPAHSLRHPSDAEAALRHLEALKGGLIGCSTSEERLLRRDGSPLWFAVTRSLARTPSGAPLYIIEIMHEIERYKRAEEARERALASERAARIRVELAEARMARLQTLTSELSRALTPMQVADLVLAQGLAALYADAGYVALLMDDGMIEMLHAPGYPGELVEQIRRFPASTPLPPADCIHEGRLLVFESAAELRAAYPDAVTQHWAETRVVVPMTVSDRTIGALGITYLDACTITDDDRHFMTTLAQQCAQALERARLYEAEKRARLAREEALAIAAHDLRNPLAAISLIAASMMRAAPEGAMGERVRERAQRLEATAAHATELLHNLLDAATIEAQSLRLAITPCEVDALLAEVIEVHTPLAEEKRLKLRTRPLGSSFWIHCDRTRLIQALTNLLGNALKFTCEGGEITLAAELDGPSVRFSVSDTGAGIAPRDIPRLFDRYWRPQEARGAGTGLGFYIVKGIVEAHGGHISVDSNPGVGTTFTITIPVEP